jgi:hypothetical protein
MVPVLPSRLPVSSPTSWVLRTYKLRSESNYKKEYIPFTVTIRDWFPNSNTIFLSLSSSVRCVNWNIISFIYMFYLSSFIAYYAH